MSVVIRNVKIKDAKALLEIYAPYVKETAISFEYEAPGVREFRNRIKTITKKFPYVVAEVDGKIAGYAYAGVFHARKAYECSVETSIYVEKNTHGTGVGRALYNALEKELKKQNISALYACIAATPRENDLHLTDASIRFHEKLGYKLAGRFTSCAVKFNDWYDMVYMEKHI